MAVSTAIVFLAFASLVAGQQFRLANIYADEMVLQMAPKSSHIWGFGEPGSEVGITLGITEYTAITAADSKWIIRLPPTAAGGPHILNIQYRPASGANEDSTLRVWFGDVWVCSGQSNMQMIIRDTFNATEETAKAITYTNLRLMLVNMDYSDTELDEIRSIGIPWSAPDNNNVPIFSALCIMYGERLSDSLNGRPIGLIASTWWGTPIESWSSTRVTSFCNTPPGTDINQNQDHVLWNAMIHPLIPLAVRGAIWYQGETNAGYNQNYYPCHIQRLYADWKASFIDGYVPVPSENNIAFPFGIVQIGPYSVGDNEQYGSVRWHQTVDQGVLPNPSMLETFMAASYDTTDPDSPTGDIHPRDKQTIADRLSNSAKWLLYNEAHSIYGPYPISAEQLMPGVMTITYNEDILVQNTTGFSYKLSTGEWISTSISSVQGRQIQVPFDPAATQLAYGYLAVVCDYKRASIYASNSERLPAQIWLWQLV